MDRLDTGIRRLDFILYGGLPSRRLHLLHGPPGSGKTLAANQVAFHHASEDGRAVYLTVAAETHATILDSVRGLDFFDETALPDRIRYVSGYGALHRDGLGALLDVVKQAVQKQGATLLVVDGLDVVRSYGASAREYRNWLYQLRALLVLYECTGLLLATEEDAEDAASVADGVIELTYHLVGPRLVREVVVYKLRGSPLLPGRHQVEITHAGLQVHPRTEVQFSEPAGASEEVRQRMAVGIEGLDGLLRGGLLSGSVAALIGAPGTGKTTVGLSFLREGAAQGQPGFYMGFGEPPARLLNHAAAVGLDLRPYAEQGLVTFLWQPPLEHFLDALAERILELLRRSEPAPPRRLFIDGIEGFVAAAVYEDRMRRFLSALSNQLRLLEVTAIMSEEILPGEIDRLESRTEPVADTTVALQRVRRGAAYHRLMTVLKMRESEYDTSVREFRIDAQGVRVDADSEGAARVLDDRRTDV